MATSIDRWERDPLFSAAEEVQNSADRMESAYRAWVPSKRNEELFRNLRTSIGTTKWQLEDFERAVKINAKNRIPDDAKARHSEFLSAIQDHISRIEDSLKDSPLLNDYASYWARLNEAERDELAQFLSGAQRQSTVMGSSEKKVASDVNSWNIDVSEEKQRSAQKNKRVYGWYGWLQRRLQRSQYQVQYNRPVQVALSLFCLLFIMGLLILGLFIVLV